MELSWGTELDDELARQEIEDEYKYSVLMILAMCCMVPVLFFGLLTLIGLVKMILGRSLENLAFVLIFGILLFWFLTLTFFLICMNARRVSDLKCGKFQYRRAVITRKGGLTNKGREGYLWFEGQTLPSQEECVVVLREVYDSVDVGNEMYLIYLKPPDANFAVRAYK